MPLALRCSPTSRRHTPAALPAGLHITGPRAAGQCGAQNTIVPQKESSHTAGSSHSGPSPTYRDAFSGHNRVKKSKPLPAPSVSRSHTFEAGDTAVYVAKPSRCGQEASACVWRSRLRGRGRGETPLLHLQCFTSLNNPRRTCRMLPSLGHPGMHRIRSILGRRLFHNSSFEMPGSIFQEQEPPQGPAPSLSPRLLSLEDPRALAAKF